MTKLHLILRIIFLAVLSGLVTWEMRALTSAPTRYVPQDIEVRLQRGATLVLDAADIAAIGGGNSHVRLQRTQDDQWLISSESENANLQLRLHGIDINEQLPSARLNSGDRFSVAGTVFAISHLAPNQLQF